MGFWRTTRDEETRPANVRHPHFAGSAIVTDKEGHKYLVSIKDELYIPWPNRSGPAVQAALVSVPEVSSVEISGGITVAREQVRARIDFVDKELMHRSYYLPLASSVGNGQDWATDHCRIYRPSHEVVNILIKRFERLERTVWQAEPRRRSVGQRSIGCNLVSLSNCWVPPRYNRLDLYL